MNCEIKEICNLVKVLEKRINKLEYKSENIYEQIYDTPPPFLKKPTQSYIK